MKRHLTEKELIEYQFELVSKMQAERICEHLEGCADCRKRAEQLERKFAALDLLRDEAEVSEDLISQVITQTQQPARAPVISFRKPAWIGAAAAVLLVGLALVSYLGKEQAPSRKVAREPSLEETEIKRPSDRNEEIAAKKMDTEAKAKVKLRGSEGLLAGVAGDVSKKIPEKPPFAPASAIELVTLPRRDNVQITIYNSADLTLVRERRNLTLKKGWNWLQFMWANTLIDPTSLSLEPMEQSGKIDIQQLVFPARLKDIGRWLIRSETEGQVPFEITYFTSGLSWRAFYMGTLSADEQKMNLAGYVRIANKSGEDYENAQTRLIVGKVHQLDKIAELAKRQYPYNRPGVIKHDYSDFYDEDEEDMKGVPLLSDVPLIGGLFRNGDMLERKEIKKEGLSEYFLYTIEGTESIPDKWGKRLISFDVNDIEVKSLYKYDEQRWGRQTIRFVAFANDQEHNLGDTPIPNGMVKIYGQADEQGHLSYVGGTSIKYIPVDEEVELNLGSARLVNVEPVLMNFETDNYVFDNKRNVAGWDEIRKWKIEVTNTRQLAVEVEITRGFGTAYWTLEFNDKDVSYEKHDATHARFKTTLQPQSKRTFTYTVTTYHGRRQEQISK